MDYLIFGVITAVSWVFAVPWALNMRHTVPSAQLPASSESESLMDLLVCLLDSSQSVRKTYERSQRRTPTHAYPAFWDASG